MNFAIIILLIVLMICFILKIPIGLSMLCAGILYFLILGEDSGLLANQVMSKLYSNSVIVAIPLFIFTANIMNSGKVTEYLFTFSKALVGKRRGAMAYINIIVSLIFSGMTGSSVADAAGIGTIELAEMKKDGYDDAFSAAITATTSTVGPIFPPSIPMVVYAMIANASVGALFLGGMIPAFMLCAVLAVYVWYISKKRNYPRGVKFTSKELFRYTIKSIPALLTPVILLGGIYSGLVTATEAGVLAALYAMIISSVVYRALGFKTLMKAIKDTVIQTGVIIAIIAGAYVMSYIVATSGMADTITDWFLGITNNKYIFLLAVNIIFLLLGMLFDTAVLQLIFVPLFLPTAAALGINVVHFGVILVLNMMIGMSTPPYGILCFITSGLTKAPLQNVFKEALPMVLMMIIVLLLVTYIPDIVMLLPNIF